LWIKNKRPSQAGISKARFKKIAPLFFNFSLVELLIQHRNDRLPQTKTFNSIAPFYFGAMKLLGYFLALLIFMAGTSWAQKIPRRETVSYTSGRHSYQGYLYKPEGNGPFPVVVWNNGRSKRLLNGNPSEYDTLAKIFTNDGYILFLPDRHMYDIVTNEYSPKTLEWLKGTHSEAEAKKRFYREYLEINARDVVAACGWIQKQPYANPKRIALAGWSSGAVASLMAAPEIRDLGACVLFSPAVSQWKSNPKILSDVMGRAIKKCQAPIFLVQGSTDGTLAPGELLRKNLETRPKPNRVQIYSYGGGSDTQLSSLAFAGWQKWGFDVMTFLEETLKK
jgi:dienelactone hydrolase